MNSTIFYLCRVFFPINLISKLYSVLGKLENNVKENIESQYNLKSLEKNEITIIMFARLNN